MYVDIRKCVAAPFLAYGIAAHAAPITYIGTLSGPAESPPNASPGIGQTTVIADSVALTLRVQVSFGGLLGPTTGAHIHCCTTSAGSGVAGVATTVPAFPGFPLNVTSGTCDSTLSLIDASSYNPSYVTASGGIAAAEAALLTGIAAGKAYLNIHSSLFPGGEIRSFLVADRIFRNGLESS